MVVGVGGCRVGVGVCRMGVGRVDGGYRVDVGWVARQDFVGLVVTGCVVRFSGKV